MFSLKAMVEEDAWAVSEIDKRVSIESWSEKLFRDCVRVGYSCWVYKDDNYIYGYGILSSSSGDAHILNIAIVPEYQHKGLGSKMMEQLIKVSRDLGNDTVYLEVRESNITARRLYNRLSFVDIGIRKDYYPTVHGREDAIVLALNL